MEEGYVYRIRYDNGGAELLASIDEVKDLLRQRDETNSVLGTFAGDPASGDDWYDFLREKLAKLGVRMVRTVADGYEEVFTLTEYKEEPHRFLGLKTGGLVPVSEKVSHSPKDFIRDVENLLSDRVAIDWNSASNLMKSVMNKAEELCFDSVTRMHSVIAKLAIIAGSWDTRILYIDYESKRHYYLLDVEDDYNYGYYRGLRDILAKGTKCRITKEVRVKRDEFEVTLPIDLIHRYQQVTGKVLDGEHLESILERLLERSIEDEVKE